MIISTTNSIEGKNIKEYLGIINTNFVLGINILSEMKAEFSDVFGGTSGSYKKKLNIIYEKAIDEIIAKAQDKKADAVIGLSIDFDEISGGAKTMIMVSATGTAVKFGHKADDRFKFFSMLEKLYDLKQKGIISEKEYAFETECVKEQYETSIKPAVEELMEDRDIDKIRIEAEAEFEKKIAGVEEQHQECSVSDDSPFSVLDDNDIVSSSYDDIDFDDSTSLEDVIVCFIKLGRYAEACKYYIDNTGLDDIPSAIDYCNEVYKSL